MRSGRDGLGGTTRGGGAGTGGAAGVVERRLRRAAEVILEREVLPGPAPLPDFRVLLARGKLWRRWGTLALGTGLLGAVAIISLSLAGWRRDVSYVVDGPVSLTDDVVEALSPREARIKSGASGAPDEVARMRFSEGSEIALGAGARVRVAGRGVHGADLVLERGRAGFKVSHLRGARWSVTSGPFVVEVVGTDFAVDWSPNQERMTLELTAGKVRVRGASVGGPIEVNAGERLVASVRDHRLTLAPLGPTWTQAQAGRGSEAEGGAWVSHRGRAAEGEGAEGAVGAGGAGSAQTSDGADAAWQRARSPEANGPSTAPRRRPTRPGLRTGGWSARGGAGRSPVEVALAAPSRGFSQTTPSALAGWSANSSSTYAPTPPAAAAPLPESPELQPSTFAAPVLPTMKLGGGGVFCSRETAQYRFEQPEDGISVANVYTLALANPDLDSTHSWCGTGAIRFRANFTDQGRRNYFGRFLRETGQMVIRLDRPTDFTGRTVTMHVFVEGPSDARFSAEIFVVHQGHWVGSEPMRELAPGRWWTVKHTFRTLNPTGGADSSNPQPYPGEGMSPVSSCNRVSLAVRTTGALRSWTGAVYVDDVGWR